MKTEKVSINFTNVELGQIDFLVERGLYSNRSEFIRESAKRLLDKHDGEFRQFVSHEAQAQAGNNRLPVRTIGGIGIIKLNHADLLDLKYSGMKANIKVIGALVVSGDITAELVAETIQSAEIFGSILAEEGIKELLGKQRHR